MPIARAICLSMLVSIGILLASPDSDAQTLRHVADVDAPVEFGVSWIDCEEGVPCIFPGFESEPEWQTYDVFGSWIDTGIDMSSWLGNEYPLVFLSVPGNTTLVPLNIPEVQTYERANAGDLATLSQTGVNSENYQHIFDDYIIVGDITGKIVFGVSIDGHLLVAQGGPLWYEIPEEYLSYYSFYAWEPNECESDQETDPFLVCPGDEWPIPSANDFTVDRYDNIKFSVWILGNGMDADTVE